MVFSEMNRPDAIGIRVYSVGMKIRFLILLSLFTSSIWAQSPPSQTPPVQGAPTTLTTPAQPSPCEISETKAPNLFLVRFETTAGTFIIEAHKEWAPFGVERLYQLVCVGFYDDSRFFRVVPKFVVQFGVAGDPRVNEFWRI